MSDKLNAGTLELLLVGVPDLGDTSFSLDPLDRLKSIDSANLALVLRLPLLLLFLLLLLLVVGEAGGDEEEEGEKQRSFRRH